ncbi:MAG: chemotaxis protein CheD [Desulfococcaceae bacterium]
MTMLRPPMEPNWAGRNVFLKPSEVFIGGIGPEAGRVTTILGSCVSVTFFSPRRRIGAICHALLARCPEPAACRTRCAEHGRYVACVLPSLLQRIRTRGVPSDDLACGLFGGSDLYGVNGVAAVGRINAETAAAFLASAGLRVRHRDVGGKAGRKLIFNTETGEIWLKRLREAGQAETDAPWKKF